MDAIHALGGVVFLVFGVWLFVVLPARRRAAMTPEQRELESLRRRTRRIERKQAWRA